MRGAGGAGDVRKSRYRAGRRWLGWQRCPAYLSLMSEALAPAAPAPRPDLPQATHLDPSPWQDLSGLAAIGILHKITELLEHGGPSGDEQPVGAGVGATLGHLKARLTCRAWRDGLPVRQFVALTRNNRCTSLSSRSPFGFFSWPFPPTPGAQASVCRTAGLCLCKLTRFPLLRHVDISTQRVHPQLCLEALCRLPELQSLTISLDQDDARPQEELTDLTLPPALTCLRLHGAGDNWLEQVSLLSRLTVLELHATPKFSLQSAVLSSIAPLSKLTGLRSLCVEHSSSWGQDSYMALQSLRSLEYLSLVGFSGRCLHSLQSLDNLRHLELLTEPETAVTLDFTHWGPFYIPSSLESASLELNALGIDCLHTVLQNLRPLQSVLSSAEFHACELDTASALALASFTALKDLYLSGVNASEEILRVLRPLAGLQALGLGGIPLTDGGLSLLKTFTLLSSLDSLCHSPGRNRGFSPCALDELVASLPMLKQLSVEVDTDAGWKSAAHGMQADVSCQIRQHLQRYQHLTTSVTSNTS